MLLTALRHTFLKKFGSDPSPPDIKFSISVLLYKQLKYTLSDSPSFVMKILSSCTFMQKPRSLISNDCREIGLNIFDSNKMLLSIQSIEEVVSSDSRKSYSRIRANVNIPWECKYIKYHVSSLNTKSNILITTSEDKIEVIDDEECHKVNFKDTFSMSENNMLTYFNTIPIFEVKFVNKRLSITSTKDFKFTCLTHRARLVTGLMSAKLNETYKAGQEYIFDVPILDYANKLYLISKQGQSIQSNIGDREYTPSVIGNVDAFIKDGAPLIVNFETYGKPIKNIVNIDSFKMIELELVDFMYHPIILSSPMFITMKIKPYKVPQVDYVNM